MMKLKYYEIDEKKLLQEATGKKIAIKLPDGLSCYAEKILAFLKENGVDVMLLAETCYGACDFIFYEDIGKIIDKIICIGEAEMPYLKKKYKPPVAFIEAKYDFDEKFIKKAFPFLQKRVGIASITPFIHKIENCSRFLEKNGYEVFIGKKGRRTAYDGQILGCDFSSAMTIANKVDSFLFIGDGFFHPVGLRIATGKQVVCANPIEKNVYSEEIEERAERTLRKRYAVIAKAMEAKKFGIIVTGKIGQRRLELAKRIKKMLEKNGRKAYIIFLNDIDEKIDYLDFECYISTACPRVAIDDAERYKKPILTPIEAEIMLGEREWKSYEFDQIF